MKNSICICCKSLVKVLIINSNMEQADSSLIKAVQDYIDPYTEGDDGEKIGWGCG